MSFERASAIADAVLLEGYVLYPYRATSLKNRYRWSFGVLAPRAWCEAGGGDAWWLCAHCLVEGTAKARVTGRLRFLQRERRSVERRTPAGYEPVDALEAAGRLWLAWDEAITHEIDFELPLSGAADGPRTVPFEVPASRALEPLHDEHGALVGRVTRERWHVQGRVHVVSAALAAERPLQRLELRVENLTEWPDTAAPRDEVTKGSCLSTHLLLSVSGGAFLSLQDPPGWAMAAVDTCKNIGVFPVLVGAEGERDLLLASPIILYDHPCIAPESPGDFFDATEIDELLTLRTQALTDDEKRQVRATDERSAALLARVEAMTPESMARLHGAIREREAVARDHEPIAVGARVRLCPGRRRTDAQDALFAGRSATVEQLKHDVDGRVFVAVTIDDDPAAELNRWYGRFHYYELDEVERIDDARGESAA